MVVKLFPWPIIVWLALTRRLRAAAVATLGAATLAVISWAAIGFSGFSSYPRLLRELSEVQGPRGVALFAILRAHGVGTTAATAVGLVVGGILLAAAALVARRPDGDRRAFSLAIVAALVASPLVWPNYLPLLIVVVALISPQFGPAWIIVILLRIPYHSGHVQSEWLPIACMVLFGATLALSVRPKRFGPPEARKERTPRPRGLGVRT